MSTPETCDDCGKTYGASWGDTTGICGACKNKQQSKDMKDLDKQEIKEKVVQDIMEMPGAMNVKDFKHKDGQRITRKEYGILLLKTVCKELREKYNEETNRADMSDLTTGS